jgi:hypothetical protein
MKIAIVLMLMTMSFSTYSQKHFVRSENSKHRVSINQYGNELKFDERTYFINKKKGWYRNDSIIWVYGHSSKNWKNMVKVGFYNNYKNYVVSVKSEKLPR